MNQEDVKKALLDLAKELNKQASSELEFTTNSAINKGLCDIKHRPYLFVLACTMDRQIPAERAWSIPHEVCEYFHVKTFEDLAILSEVEIIDCFKKKNLHRFNDIMGKCFYEAVQRINTIYHGDASQIWSDNPSSAAVVYRFLCFHGVGIKIATMAANILHRNFRVSFSDLSAIDISPDVHVCRILYRLGFTETEDRLAALYKAKEINPDYPGILDLACWHLGKFYCHSNTTECKNCPMTNVCFWYLTLKN